jgi:hypothetical protein
VFDLESHPPEGGRADQAGVARDDIPIDVIRDDQGKIGSGAGQRAPEWPGIQHAEQEVNVSSGEPVPVVVDGPEVGRDAKLDTGGRAGDVVMPADQAAEPFRQRIDDAGGADIR